MIENLKKGFIPVMLTPFESNGQINYDILTQLTGLYLNAGASGLFANCLSSEMFELKDDEKIQVIKHVVKTVNGTVPVVATGNFGSSIADQASFIKKVRDAGADAVIMITGLVAAKEDPDTLFNDRVFELLALTEDIPLGFYECPEPYKRVLSPGQLSEFVATGRVIYHKDTCLDINQVKEKIKGAKTNSNFGLYDAYMGHAVQSLKAGSAGLSCIQGNFFPELIVWLCDNYANESLIAEVNMVQQFLIDNMDVMHNVYPIIAKYFLSKRGLKISTVTRRDVGLFSSVTRRKIEGLFTDYKYLQNKLNVNIYL